MFQLKPVTQKGAPKIQEIFDVDPPRAQIANHSFMYVTITFTPPSMQVSGCACTSVCHFVSHHLLPYFGSPFFLPVCVPLSHCFSFCFGKHATFTWIEVVLHFTDFFLLAMWPFSLCSWPQSFKYCTLPSFQIRLLIVKSHL